VQVARASVGVRQLAQQERAAVAEPGGVAAELVSRVRLRHTGRLVAHEQGQSAGPQPGGIETELLRQRLVEDQQAGFGHHRRLPGDGHLRDRVGEVAAQADVHDLNGTGRAQTAALSRHTGPGNVTG
jgi:hypothetical protein